MPVLALGSHAAKVGQGALRQHELFTLEHDTTLVLLSAFGVPRLWGYALDAAARGFREGFVRPHDGRAVTRLHLALDGAREALRVATSALIEQRTPDAGLLAVTFARDAVHVLCVGPGRVYRERAGSAQRLTPREDLAAGLLRASPAFCSEPLARGDLLFGGSRSAFGEESRAALGARNAHERPEALVALLNAKAVASGIGVASFAFRG